MTDLFQSADDLGEYLFRIIDNGGASADRYTVALSDGDGFVLSGAPSHPQGVSLSIKGLLRHKCQYMPGVASIFDAAEMAENATVWPVKIGAAYRDRQEIKAVE